MILASTNSHSLLLLLSASLRKSGASAIIHGNAPLGAGPGSWSDHHRTSHFLTDLCLLIMMLYLQK